MIQQNRPLFKLNMTKTTTITKRKRCNKCRLANEAQKKYTVRENKTFQQRIIVYIMEQNFT